VAKLVKKQNIVEMVYAKFRNKKPLVLQAYRTKNNLSKKQRKSFSKLAKLTEERKIMICRADKDGKIVILNYDDYDAIMTRELQQLEKLDVSVDGSNTNLEKVRYVCNELVVKLHAIGELKDELLLPITGMKCKNNAYRKVNDASAKYFRCNTPAYAYPLFRTHKLTPENLLNVDNKEIPVPLLQSAKNTSTSRIIAFLEFILKPISAEFCKNCPNKFRQDSRQYIGDLLMWKERLTKILETAKQKPVFYIVAADVKALYPSLYRDTVTKALECALEKHSDYSAEARKILFELKKICLNNVFTQYGDQLYIQKTES